MSRERTHVVLTVWPMTVLFIVGLVRGWPAIEGATSYAASAPSTWSWLALHTFVVLLSLLAYSIGWSRFQPDELSGHPYRSVGCVRLQKLAGGVAWGLLFAHLILQWVMTLRVGPVALSHYELLRGFLSRPPVLAFYVFGLASLGAYLAQGVAASFRAWGHGTRPESSRWLELGCTFAAAMVTLMAVNVLSHFTTGRAYWAASDATSSNASAGDEGSPP